MYSTKTAYVTRLELEVDWGVVSVRCDVMISLEFATLYNPLSSSVLLSRVGNYGSEHVTQQNRKLADLLTSLTT